MTMRTSNENDTRHDRVYPGGQPDRWVDARLPLPVYKNPEPRLPESAKEARKTAPEGTSRAAALAYRAGIPVAASEMICAAFDQRDARIAALEQRVAVLEARLNGHECPNPQAHEQ